MEERGGLRRRAPSSSCASWARARSPACGSTIPTGSTRPANTSGGSRKARSLATARRLVPDLGPSEAEALAAHYRAQRRRPTRPRREARPLWIVAEKILVPGEPLPDWWAVAGTTGYDFLGSVNGLFVDRGTSRQHDGDLPALRGSARGHGRSDLRRQAPHHAGLDGERDQPARPSPRPDLRAQSPLRDFTLPSLVARAARGHRRLPRLSHLRGRRRRRAERARPRLHRARGGAGQAAEPAPSTSPSSTSSATRCSCDTPRRPMPSERAERRHFAMRFQQITGPVTAKGVEDTALYRLQPARLAERGGQRSRPLRRAHRGLPRQERPPSGALAGHAPRARRPTTPSGARTSARGSTCSPRCPELWSAEVRRWRAIARRFKREVDGQAAPDRERRVPALPDARRRLAPARCRRAPRGVHRPHPRLHGEGDQGGQGPHELGESRSSPTTTAMRGIRHAPARAGQSLHRREPPVPGARSPAHGAVNSLAQTLLKIVAPGIPDFYQGTELWDLSLVDPDNRRPVDFARRQSRARRLWPRASPPRSARPERARARARSRPGRTGA